MKPVESCCNAADGTMLTVYMWAVDQPFWVGQVAQKALVRRLLLSSGFWRDA